MNVQEFRRELGLLFGAIVLTGCSTTGGPDLSEMSFSDEPLVGKFVWYDLITDDATAIDAPGRVVWTELLACCLVLAGCSGNVGVGVSVGVPVGNHGYVSVGGTRWRSDHNGYHVHGCHSSHTPPMRARLDLLSWLGKRWKEKSSLRSA